MEEDIKVLEEFITRPHIYGTNIPRIKNCIKFLIEKYKELEAINKIQEYRIKIIDEREFIPTSKVRDKIEEYNDILDYSETEEGMAELKDYEYEEAEYGKKILQELLQEGDDK